MENNDKFVANPLIVFREEFDDWAVLFNPDDGKGFGLNPTGILIWKHLDGQHTIEDISTKIHENCEDVPKDVETHIKELIQDLLEHGLVGCEVKEV